MNKLNEIMAGFDSKKLAYAIWGLSGLSSLIVIISNITYGSYIGIIINLVALVFQCLLGYTIYRGKNDKFTMVTIILIALFNFNLAGLVAIIMRLVLRKAASQEKTLAIRNKWFVPVIVAVAMVVINIVIGGFTVWGILSGMINVLYYLVFSYWFIRYL